MSAALLEWKEEPVSPLTEEPWASEETLYLTGFEHADFKVETENDEEACETKAEIASKLLDNLDQLEDLDEWIKSEGLSYTITNKLTKEYIRRLHRLYL